MAERWHRGKPNNHARAHGRNPPPPRLERAVLYGWHTVKAALENPARRMRRIMATENALRRLADENVPLPFAPETVRPADLERLLGPEAVHQGIAAEADPLPSPELDEIGTTGPILVLDQITDPHNVGAIFRTAAAFAASAIVTTARHSPEATGVLAKSASGALEYVPLVTVQNLARALAALKERGVLLVGLDSEGPADLSAVALRMPLALVLGAEGKGLRQLTSATCSRGSTCRARSRASTSRTPPRSRSTSRTGRPNPDPEKQEASSRWLPD